MTDKLSIAVHALPMHMLTLLSVDEILLPRYMNWSTNFRVFPFNEKMVPSWLSLMKSVLSNRDPSFFICMYIDLLNKGQVTAMFNLKSFKSDYLDLTDEGESNPSSLICFIITDLYIRFSFEFHYYTDIFRLWNNVLMDKSID